MTGASVAVGSRESGDPRFDLAFRPSNGRPSNPVRFRELTCAHLSVDGGPSQASAPLDLGACQQSILRFRRHDIQPFCALSPESLPLPRDSPGHRPGSIAPAAWTNSRHSEWVQAVQDERSELGSFCRMGTPTRHSDPGPVHCWVSESSGRRTSSASSSPHVPTRPLRQVLLTVRCGCARGRSRSGGAGCSSAGERRRTGCPRSRGGCSRSRARSGSLSGRDRGSLDAA